MTEYDLFGRPDVSAISVWQPWAQAIAVGLKSIETRSWATGYRGPILIQASRQWTPREVRFQFHAVHTVRAALGCDDERVLAFEHKPPLGAVVAVAELVACSSTDYWKGAISGLEEFFGDFSPGRYGWELAGVVRLDRPVECRGAQGLWRPSGDLLRRVQDAIGWPLKRKAAT